jgi:hypothetical protein
MAVIAPPHSKEFLQAIMKAGRPGELACTHQFFTDAQEALGAFLSFGGSGTIVFRGHAAQFSRDGSYGIPEGAIVESAMAYNGEAGCEVRREGQRWRFVRIVEKPSSTWRIGTWSVHTKPPEVHKLFLEIGANPRELDRIEMYRSFVIRFRGLTDLSQSRPP